MSWQQNVHDYIDFLRQKYEVSHEEILQELSSQRVPAGIYSGELTPLQATAQHLHASGESVHSIATQLARPARDVQKLLTAQGRIGEAQGPDVPIGCFSDKTLSAGEHIIEELQRRGITIQEIAKLLNKSERTIWTQHYRIQKKRGESNE